MTLTTLARRANKNNIDRLISGHRLPDRRVCRQLMRGRIPSLERLEARELLSVAHDLAVAIAPYQPALTSALNAATQLPLVGNQLTGLSEFATALQNTEASINSKTQNITSNGHYQVSVPLPSLSKTFSLNLGLDAFLKAAAVGSVHAEINPTLTIGFDVAAGAASLDVGQTRFDIGFGLSLPGFQGTFSLNGLLFTKAVDAGTSFNGDLGFRFASGGAVNAQFSGNAHVLMGLSVSFVDPALNASFNPTFHTTLDMNWGINAANNQLNAPSIQLRDFGLEADSFLHGFLGDVVKTVQKFTKPIQPFVDVFQTPVPILSAFDSSETIGTLMLKGAGTSSAQQDSFKLMVQIINAVNSIDLSGNTGGAVIPFGTITVTGNPRQAGGFGFNTSSVSTAIDDIIGIPALQTVEDALRKVGNYAGTTSTAGFQFPLLENPGSVIAGILLGQPDTTLFSFSTGQQHFELAPSLGVGIPGVLGIFLSAGITFDANLTMGYDTAGLLAYAQNPSKVGKLLHGFYFDNSINTSIPPKPNAPAIRKTGLYLQGTMELKADALLAHASGGLYGSITVELSNTDATDHVHLDTMINNLTSGGRVFKLGGKLYASADVSLELSLPIGPDITLFRFNLAHEELLNFDPPPPPSGIPIHVVDVTNQHTLLLDPAKMAVGSVVTVQPFYDTTVTVGGSTFEADGVRVDYPGEIYLYVERKNNANTNYYNLIALSSAAPDGVSINVIDPFRVFDDEGASNPSPAQTKPGVLLVGGKNVVYTYNEAPDGSHPNVLLAGGYGSNTLSGGTMTFGNFIPGGRIAQAKAHFANTTGFDGAGQGLINSVIDAAVAPANPAGIIGAKMTSSRGGLMMGGPGNNSFIAMGVGAYEMIGGSWLNSFNISPSFSGGVATYAIDGGPYGQSSMIVSVPFDETVLFENATVPDKYHTQYKALAVGGKHGPSAVAHGIQTVKVVASPGSIIEFGDTSEVNVTFSIAGGARLKFGGTAAPDVFDVDVRGPFAAKKDHITVGGLFTDPARPTTLLDVNPLVPGVSATSVPDPIDDFGRMPSYLPTRWPDPVYTITRTFGTNGRTLSIPFAVSDPDSSSIIVDGKGASDTYRIELGVGGFLDVMIDDSDRATRNSATVRLREPDTAFTRAVLTDASFKAEFYTLPFYVNNMAMYMRDRYPEFYAGGPFYNVWPKYAEALNSVYYSPTVSFGANIDVGLKFSNKPQKFVIDRPTAPQDITIAFGIYKRSWPSGGYPPGTSFNFFDNSAGPFAQIPSWVYDPDGPSSEIVYLGPAPLGPVPGYGGHFRTLFGPSTIDILNNAGSLSIDLNFKEAVNAPAPVNVAQFFTTYDADGSPPAVYYASEIVAEVSSNSGTLSFHGSLNGTINVLSNSGTVSFNFPALGTTGSVVNVLGSTGSINVAYVEYGRLHMRFGDGGSLANIRGTTTFAPGGNYNVTLDDRHNPAAGRQWSVQTTQVTVGDLKTVFGGTNGLFGMLEVRPNPGSAVHYDSTSLLTNSTIIGTGNGNTLVGPPLAGGPTWRIEGVDSGTMPLPNSRMLRWVNIQTLVGNGSNDTFRFVGGSVSGSVDGAGGSNTLVYDRPPVPFVVDLAHGKAPLVGGTVSNIQAVVPDPAARPTLSVGAGPDQNPKEGDLVSLSGASINYSGNVADVSLTIDWGDGTSVPGAITWQSGVGKVTSTHRYLDNGTYVATLHAVGAQATTAQDSVRFDVANIAPVALVGGDANLSAGQSLLRTGSFTDPGADTWTATVDYGTGAGFVPLVLNSDKTFSLANKYSNDGTFTVVIRVTDDDGGIDTQQFNVSVGAPTDTTPPRVTSFKTTKKNNNLATIIVTFSEGMAPKGVLSLGSYRLISAGKDKKFGTKDDKTLALGKVLYDQAKRLATLTVKKPVALNQPFQFTVRGSGVITDFAENSIDGDNNGIPGGDFIGRFGTNPRK